MIYIKDPLKWLAHSRYPINISYYYDNGNIFWKGHLSSAVTFLSQVTLVSEQARPWDLLPVSNLIKYKVEFQKRYVSRNEKEKKSISEHINHCVAISIPFCSHSVVWSNINCICGRIMSYCQSQVCNTASSILLYQDILWFQIPMSNGWFS